MSSNRPVVDIKPFEQFKVLLGKDLIRLKKNSRPLRVQTIFMCVFGYLMSSQFFRQAEASWVYRILMFISGYTSRSMITQLVTDRQLKFRATFKLMGLGDLPYICSKVFGNFFIGFFFFILFFSVACVFSYN